jgi:molybdopterin/thiamine biosynthesis adenylyltransferase
MFRKQIELIGTNQQKLYNKKIVVVGAGGLGNFVISELSCVGLKEIFLFDFDEIEISNIHRQFNFLQKEEGLKKAEILAKKMERCNTKITPITKKFKTFNKKVDLIIDCSDNFKVRKKISKFAKQNKIPWLYGSVEGFIGQVCLFKNGNLNIFNIPNNYKVKGVLPPMVGIVASIEAMVAIKYLSEMEVEFDKLYYIDFHKGLEVMGFKI